MAEVISDDEYKQFVFYKNSWQERQMALNNARAELSALCQRVEELESENAALSANSEAVHRAIGEMTGHPELATVYAVQAVIDQRDTLQPRKCVEGAKCFERGWLAAIEAAATLSDEMYADEVATEIRALTPQASCDCHPLNPSEHDAATLEAWHERI